LSSACLVHPVEPHAFVEVGEMGGAGARPFCRYCAAAHYLCHAWASCDISEGRTHSLRLRARPDTGSSARHRKMWHCRPHNSPQSAEVDLCSILTQAGSDSDGRPNQDTPSMVDRQSNKWGLSTGATRVAFYSCRDWKHIGLMAPN